MMRNPKQPFWKKSPLWRDKRRPQHLGAFKKWRRENSGEAERIEDRFARENFEQGALPWKFSDEYES